MDGLRVVLSLALQRTGEDSMKYAIDEERNTLWIELKGKLYPFNSCDFFKPVHFLGDDMSSYGTCPCLLDLSEFKEVEDD